MKFFSEIDETAEQGQPRKQDQQSKPKHTTNTKQAHPHKRKQKNAPLKTVKPSSSPSTHSSVSTSTSTSTSTFNHCTNADIATASVPNKNVETIQGGGGSSGSGCFLRGCGGSGGGGGSQHMEMNGKECKNTIVAPGMHLGGTAVAVEDGEAVGRDGGGGGEGVEGEEGTGWRKGNENKQNGGEKEPMERNGVWDSVAVKKRKRTQTEVFGHESTCKKRGSKTQSIGGLNKANAMTKGGIERRMSRHKETDTQILPTESNMPSSSIDSFPPPAQPLADTRPKKHTPKTRIGLRVRTQWPDDDDWYSGTVFAYSVGSRLYTALFEDGTFYGCRVWLSATQVDLFNRQFLQHNEQA